MGPDHPLILLALIGAALVVMRWWLADYRATRRGAAPAAGLPGATPAAPRATAIAVAGALLLLAGETCDSASASSRPA
jgi:hypothetical protein